MKLLYLEARKGILRKSVLIALILFLCLDVLRSEERRVGKECS